MLMKEFEDDTNKQRDKLCSLIERFNIAYMTILLKAIYRVNEISIKLSMALYTELEQIFGTNCMLTEKQNSGCNPKKRKCSWRNHSP